MPKTPRANGLPVDPYLFVLILFLAMLAGTASALRAQGIPSDALYRDFRPTGEFLFELDGEEVEGAEIYFSDRSASYLIMTHKLSSPVLISPRTASVESIDLMKVRKQDSGSIDLMADAAFNRLGSFEIQGQEIVFQVKGQQAKLKPKPPLLGLSAPEKLRAYKPEYDLKARDYNPVGRHLDTLRSFGKEARVLVYFGTWCPTCGRLVPRVLRVEDELEGAKLSFEYYGLPRNLDDDPAAKRDDIHGVPAGIVYVDGREVARLGVEELNSPEVALARILQGS